MGGSGTRGLAGTGAGGWRTPAPPLPRHGELSAGLLWGHPLPPTREPWPLKPLPWRLNGEPMANTNGRGRSARFLGQTTPPHPISSDYHSPRWCCTAQLKSVADAEDGHEHFDTSQSYQDRGHHFVVLQPADAASMGSSISCVRGLHRSLINLHLVGIRDEFTDRQQKIRRPHIRKLTHLPHSLFLGFEASAAHLIGVPPPRASLHTGCA